MKRIKNLFQVFLITLGVLFQSCEKENVTEEHQYSYISKTVNLNEMLSDDFKAKRKGGEVDYDMQVSSEFKTNFFIPKELKDIEELKLLIKSNLNKIDGVLYYKINGEIVDEIFIKSGEFFENEINNLEEKSRKNGCSFDGIRSCASNSMRSGTRVSRIICAFAFYECYAEAVASCIEINCI
ncbi:hypothetical protein [Tenacibaculum sp. A30]|uniref:hypothetical protein n=1 Tax=Tenacibaculum sp. A30 TaxID=3442644 RepID=UPI003EB71424